MSQPMPDALVTIERLADEAMAYIDRFIAGELPHDSRRLQDAWHTIHTREVLNGLFLPIVVTWTHPAGWVCLDLAGGPGPRSTMLWIPPVLRSLRAYLHRLCDSQTVIYVVADFFTWPPDAQRAHFVETARDQYPQESTA